MRWICLLWQRRRWLTLTKSQLNRAILSQKLAFVVVLWGGVSAAAAQALDCPVLSFDDVLGLGRDHQHAVPSSADLAAIRPDSLATLVYTSGTTGSPKVGLAIVACGSANLVMLQKHEML